MARRCWSARLGRVALVTAALALGVRAAPAASAATAPAHEFHVRGSVEQVAVTGARPRDAAVLTDGSGRAVARGRTDTAGSLLFRGVHPGSGYVVAIGGRRSPAVTVTSPDTTPPQSLYSSQHLSPGFGYLRTRDGTLLSIDVRLPGPVDGGPYPTVVEYSGYDPSNPDGHQPASTVAGLFGFATVGVNMRGTGCSGGAFDYFETLQSLDGYDAIETIAAQPWVANGEVGMVGISYPGISQLFVAATRPPHLAAIAPLAAIDDTYATVYPGGIFNNGFALGWARDRAADARPAGQSWAAERIAHGDAVCKADQALRLQAPSVTAQMRADRFDDPTRLDPLAPATFVHDIDVPVFIAGAWQDEETGDHFAEMLDDFAPDVPLVATLMNGVHADALGPAVLSRWLEFLDFYVARRIPSVPPATRALAAAALPRVFGAGVTLAPDRFTGYADYASALSAYQQEPRVRVLFDVGAGGAPGAPVPAFEADFPSWPPPATTATAWYAQPGGALGPAAPSAAGATGDTFTYDPHAYPRTDAAPEPATSLGAVPRYDWKPLPHGDAVAYVTPPLAHDTVTVGTGSADLWLRTTVPDIDLEVTISEVRPDGQETYVQSGWLRVSQRKLDASRSTELLPVQTHTRADAAPLPRGRPTLVRVPLYPFGHVFRAGSRVRIVVQPPGGNRPAWAFAAITYPRAPRVTIERSAAYPTRIVLPVVPGVAVPTPLPTCGSLRGQPCRLYTGP